MALDELVRFYETLAPQDVARFGEFYAADARFSDPFNDVRGIPAIQRIFEHMFRQVDAPRFVVTERLHGPGSAMLVWEFRFRRSGRDELIRGASHLRFDADGKVVDHRDYWDAAGELYARLPLLGGLMRLLRRAFAA